jgi:hypothetical protein
LLTFENEKNVFTTRHFEFLRLATVFLIVFQLKITTKMLKYLHWKVKRTKSTFATYLNGLKWCLLTLRSWFMRLLSSILSGLIQLEWPETCKASKKLRLWKRPVKWQTNGHFWQWVNFVFQCLKIWCWFHKYAFWSCIHDEPTRIRVESTRVVAEFECGAACWFNTHACDSFSKRPQVCSYTLGLCMYCNKVRRIVSKLHATY